MLGSPARLAGRLPLFSRYIWGVRSDVFAPNAYASRRFGPSYRFRPWLLLDASQLEPIERLINEGTDEEALAFKKAQIASLAGTAVVGSLLASACATFLTLDTLAQIHIVVRAIFTIALVLCLLAVYFTLVQQRGLTAVDADELRLWLWNGRRRTMEQLDPTADSEALREHRAKTVRESSVTSSIILEAPLELLNIAITVFLAGRIAYLACVMADHAHLGTGPHWGYTAVLIVFVVRMAFPLLVFGQALGLKDTELARYSQLRESGGKKDLAQRVVVNTYGKREAR